MSGKIVVLDFEAGYPTAAEAKRRLPIELDLARRNGVAVVKIIHGYGSSGKGGKLRSSIRSALAQYRHAGAVGRVVFGEAWSIFDESTRALLERYPKLRGDRDLERSNPGITIMEVAREPSKVV
ncbi:MAG: Smr/MutS family protein [Gemmatimonadota bacterium]